MRTSTDKSTRHLLTAHPDLFFDFESFMEFIIAVPKYYFVHDTIFASRVLTRNRECSQVA